MLLCGGVCVCVCGEGLKCQLECILCVGGAAVDATLLSFSLQQTVCIQALL